MYLFKKDDKKEILKGRKIKYVAEEIGVTRQFLSRVFGKKKTCSKLVAYCIVKCLDSEAEINDYFKYVE